MCLILIWKIRDFVLKPMVEIAPYLRHPVLNLTMEQLLKKLLENA